MTKECVICGDDFEAIRKNRQYCDKCQKNTAKARYREERAIQDSKYRMGELPSQQIKEMVCKYCSQTYHTYAGRSYCSDRCREAYNIENAKCIVCGVLLYPLDIIKSSGRGYCSDKCKNKMKWERAMERGDVIPCENCGKEFISSGYANVCCSNDCRKALKVTNITPLHL